MAYSFLMTSPRLLPVQHEFLGNHEDAHEGDAQREEESRDLEGCVESLSFLSSPTTGAMASRARLMQLHMPREAVISSPRPRLRSSPPASFIVLQFVFRVEMHPSMKVYVVLLGGGVRLQ